MVWQERGGAGGCAGLTTSARTRVRTFSPISGEMSLPNCCRVVRKRFSLLSCRAPHVAGSCWFVSEEEEEEEGPLLNLWGGDGAPFSVGGEWFIPLGTVRGRQRRYRASEGHGSEGRCLRGSLFHPYACCKQGNHQNSGCGQSRAHMLS